MTHRNFMDVEDLEVYKKLCGLPIHVCDLTHKWPQEEKYECLSIVEWILEHMGTESPIARTPLAFR